MEKMSFLLTDRLEKRLFQPSYILHMGASESRPYDPKASAALDANVAPGVVWL
jgi:hypothetical protein